MVCLVYGHTEVAYPVVCPQRHRKPHMFLLKTTSQARVQGTGKEKLGFIFIEYRTTDQSQSLRITAVGVQMMMSCFSHAVNNTQSQQGFCDRLRRKIGPCVSFPLSISFFTIFCTIKGKLLKVNLYFHFIRCVKTLLCLSKCHGLLINTKKALKRPKAVKCHHFH